MNTILYRNLSELIKIIAIQDKTRYGLRETRSGYEVFNVATGEIVASGTTVTRLKLEIMTKWVVSEPVDSMV